MKYFRTSPSVSLHKKSELTTCYFHSILLPNLQFDTHLHNKNFKLIVCFQEAQPQFLILLYITLTNLSTYQNYVKVLFSYSSQRHKLLLIFHLDIDLFNKISAINRCKSFICLPLSKIKLAACTVSKQSQNKAFHSLPTRKNLS